MSHFTTCGDDDLDWLSPSPQVQDWAVAQSLKSTRIHHQGIQAIVMAASTGLAVVDANAQICFANPAAVQLLGLADTPQVPSPPLSACSLVVGQPFPWALSAAQPQMVKLGDQVRPVTWQVVPLTWAQQPAHLVQLFTYGEASQTPLDQALSALVQQQTAGLQLRYDLSRQLSHSLTPVDLIHQLLRQLPQVVTHDISAGLVCVGSQHHCLLQLDRPITAGVERDVQQRLLKTFNRMCPDQAMDSAVPMALSCIHRAEFSPDSPSLDQLQSVFLVPIILPDTERVVGLILVGAETPEAFSADQVKLLYGVAQQAAQSLAQLRSLLDTEQQNLEHLVENLPEGVLLLDSQRQVRLANPAAQTCLTLLGLDADQPIDQLGNRTFDQFLLPPPAYRSGHDLRLPGAVERLMEVRVQPFHNQLGEADQGWVMVMLDVTAQRQAEEVARIRERAIAASSNGVVITNANQPGCPIVYVNPAFERITGYSAAEVVGQSCRMLQSGDRNQPGLATLRQALTVQQACSVVLRNYRKDGSLFWNELNVSPVLDDAGEVTHFVGILNDVTERRQAEAQLLHNAFHDVLTGLPNRALFMKQLEQAVSRSHRNPDYLFAVLFLDLDRFKTINDSLGHQAGDAMLQIVAERLSQCLRLEDMVARLGGDEFAILLDEITSLNDAIHVAHRIQQTLDQPLVIDGHDVFTSSSVGIALSATGYSQAEDLLRDADIAMYRAKRSGKARYEVFDREMHARALALLRLEADLRHAIERQQLELYYQPIVALTSGKVQGVEALLRWNHPERGLVSPDDFIPLAEEMGLIVDIGWWVLRQATQQLQDWIALGITHPLTVSVNLSAKQFSQPDLGEQIQAILQETGLAAHCLKLEITESVIMENVAAAVNVLKPLQAAGMEVYMDDFGTGFSSLSYLHRLPIDVMKIDRSFIQSLHHTGESLEIVRTIIRLAENLGMHAIAEGVETETQLRQLQLLGCHAGQGYLFSHPLPAAAAADWLRSQP